MRRLMTEVRGGRRLEERVNISPPPTEAISMEVCWALSLRKKCQKTTLLCFVSNATLHRYSLRRVQSLMKRNMSTFSFGR